tara:strand:- start:440 stop:733 length:294 start_codon:yes stop_codon:yes gene_type:complete
MNREEIVEFIEDEYPAVDWEEIVLFDDIPEAFVGVAERFNMDPVAAYDYDKCIEIYMEDGCTYDEAVEHFGVNVIGTWAGDRTPVFLHMAERREYAR